MSDFRKPIRRPRKDSVSRAIQSARDAVQQKYVYQESEAPEAPEEEEDTAMEETGASSMDRIASAMEQMLAMQQQQSALIAALQKDAASRHVREETRPKARQEVRQRFRNEPEGVKDRKGNVIFRRSFESVDPMDLPQEFLDALKADDYTVEWKSEYALNMRRVTYISKLQANGGWEPVLNERIPGRYPGEPEEPIRHEGMILMERPAALSRQARREDYEKSRDQINMRQRNWGVSSKREDYFDPHTAEAEKHTILRKTLEQADSSWAPELQVSSGDDFM